MLDASKNCSICHRHTLWRASSPIGGNKDPTTSRNVFYRNTYLDGSFESSKHASMRKIHKLSSGAEHVAESLCTQMHSPVVNATEQQVPAPKVLAEPAVPERVPVASNESPIQTPSISGTAA